MADQTLRNASITFSLPEGDDKDTNTSVDVEVTAKFNDKFDILIAGKMNFAGTDTWEDTGNQSYKYTLEAVPVSLSQISGDVKTKIVIKPNGNDTVIFNYRLELIFDDGNPDTAVIVLTQAREGITLSQNATTYTS